MSLYDIAVKKLGFPTIELFVKVSGIPNFKTSYHFQLFAFIVTVEDVFRVEVSSGSNVVSMCVCVCRQEAMGRPSATVPSLRGCL